MSRKLEDLHPTVHTVVEGLLKMCQDTGIPILITCTFRSPEEQDELYTQGRTKPGKIVTNARGGYSYHNYGLAFDFCVLKDGNPVWDLKVNVNENEIPDYNEVGELGESLGLEWGGAWPHPDFPHFQYTFGLTIEELLNGAEIPNE